MNISGPYSLNVFQDSYDNKIFIFGEIHNSFNDCKTFYIKISDLLENIINDYDDVSVLLETDNLKLNNTECYTVNIGEFLNLIQLQKYYKNIVKSIDIRYDTNLGKYLEILNSLIYNETSHNDDKINLLFKKCIEEINILNDIGIIEYLRNSLYLEKLRFFNLYDSTSNDEKVIYLVNEINKIILNASSETCDTKEDCLNMIEIINYSVMDIFVLLNIFNNDNKILIIYCGNDHAEMYKNVLNNLHYKHLLEIKTSDYYNKCLYVNKMYNLYDLIH